MNILIVGASGLVGSRLFDGLSDGHIVHGTWLSSEGPASRMFRWNIIKDTPEMLLQRGRPDVVITVLRAGRDCPVELLRHVFCGLGGFCRTNSIHLVHFSCDSVFGGEDGVFSEESLCRPCASDGEAARTVEEALLMSMASVAIVRVSHVFGMYPDRRFDRRLAVLESSLERGAEVSRFKDSFKQPLWAGELVRPVSEIIRRRFTGVLHLAGEPHTQYDFARSFAVACGYEIGRIRPVFKDETEAGEKLCSRSLLCTRKAANDFGFSPMPLPLSMAEAVKQKLRR
ncbi:MAG: sugar nucleotide-binding protein [bacterium]